MDLPKLGELHLRELEAGNDVYLKGSNLRILAITVNKSNQENVEYVPVKAKAGYAAGYNDPEFIASLPRYHIPNLPKNKTFRIFPTTGDSMLPFPEGTDIVAEYLQDWTSLKPGTPCIVLLKSDGHDLLFKLLTYQKKENHFLLRSLNHLYAPYTVPAEEILEIWKYHSHHTRQLPESTPLHQVMTAIAAMQEEIRELKRS
ncbi:S24 family peptidase [Anseongella ginsenosidimutans]|uniref:S24 family peptidase n=1 Tax=Anseongella ginsenosidimutans TaxID=496056 RepID=UPI001CEFACA1|nr:S24/S26 family peptidase [Anseongella ginsenosidimutans]